MEMHPFSCGLSLVRNHQYQYAYIDIWNRQIIPFGKYIWCDPHFEFMPDFELEETLPSEQSNMKKRNIIYTSDDNFNDSSWNDKEDWEDQRLDAFEGDESNYWNID